MGKSPGKWIKTLLFGKKTTRSQSVRGKNASKAGNDKGSTMADGPSLSTDKSPVISEPVLVSTHSNVISSELEKGNSSSLVSNASVILASTQGAENQEIAQTVESEMFREERAALKAQSAFRGYLARKAFRALKGIISLQALVRGHLVRRQAIVSLRCTLGIIRLQALVRGQKVRSSGLGHEVNTKFCQEKITVFECSEPGKGKLYANTFVCKLLSSSLVVMPLQLLYDQEEPNSVPNWMERWTVSCFWKTPFIPKKVLDSKSQAKKRGHAMVSESGKPKRTVRRTSPSYNDSSSTNITTESEKSKRSVRKASASSDSVQDPPQSELEKVKRNLRKVSSAYAETSDKAMNNGTESPHIVKKVVDTSLDIPEQSIHDSTEKAKEDFAVTPQPKAEIEISSESMVEEVPIDQSIDNPPVIESNQFLIIDKEEKFSQTNGDMAVKEEENCNENQKSNKRRSSFSAKSEYAENGVQNTPTLPSYMQATESAKAKLRRDSLPKIDSDSAEKNGIVRRHSLPSSTNGKVTSSSPRTHRLLHANGKGGARNDKSLMSSRDNHDKPILVEWRR